MSVRDLMTEAETNPVQPSRPDRAVVVHGNVDSGEWEGYMQEYPGFKTVYSAETMAHGSQQMGVAQQQLEDDLLQESLKVYALGGDGVDELTQNALVEKALAESAGAVVVLPLREADREARDDIRDRLSRAGAVVVTRLRDAADYVTARVQ